MSYTLEDDDKEIIPEASNETTYSFIDDEEEKTKDQVKTADKKESKPWYDLSETAPVKIGKSIVRGVGTTIADVHSASSKGASKGSIGDLLGFRNENAEEPELSK